MFHEAKGKVVVIVAHPRLSEDFSRLKGPIAILIPQPVNPFTVRDKDLTIHNHNTTRVVEAVRNFADRHIRPRTSHDIIQNPEGSVGRFAQHPVVVGRKRRQQQSAIIEERHATYGWFKSVRTETFDDPTGVNPRHHKTIARPKILAAIEVLLGPRGNHASDALFSQKGLRRHQRERLTPWGLPFQAKRFFSSAFKHPDQNGMRSLRQTNGTHFGSEWMNAIMIDHQGVIDLKLRTIVTGQ